MVTTAITGWAGRWASKIDALDPGFFGELYRAAPGRRQVIFAVLAQLEATGAVPDDLGQLGRRLRHSKGTVLLQEAYGSDPSGYRRALSKLGGGPAKPKLYSRLHEEFGQHTDPRLVKLLSHLGAVGETRLKIVTTLPPAARHRGLVEMITSVEGAAHLAAFIEALQTYCSQASPEQLAVKSGPCWINGLGMR
jgi:hypothetical protein